MKKFLLSACLVASLGYFNQSMAQCSGANVSITNFVVLANPSTVTYQFTWAFVQGNASVQVVYYCNNVQVGSEACIPRLKDSAAGPHIVSGSFPITCAGTIKVEVGIWTNPNCGGTYCVAVSRIISQSPPLPVDFKSFSATRNHSNVTLKWETMTEKNCTGFAVERNINGTWQEIAMIASQAPGGNSSDLLSYQYNDLNNTKGISQYRIRQVDFDNRSKYTEIRTVRGEAQIGKIIVYPNPTFDGRVKVSFEDASVLRDISLMDMNGRVLKQWKAITDNNITIENLAMGMYTLRVVVPETGEQTVEKIVVNKK